VNKLFLTFCAVCFLIGMGSIANATLTFYEPFDYAYGDLTTVSGGIWVNHSGTVGQWSTMNIDGDLSAGTSLAYPGFSLSSGRRVLKAAYMTEDVHRSFATVSTGDLYFSALVKVTTAPTNEHYFLHFNEGAGFTVFPVRVFVAATTGGVTFGLSWEGANAGATKTGTFSLNSTHLIVARLQMFGGTANDTASLWIDPSSSSFGNTEPTPYATDTSTLSNYVAVANGIRAFDMRAASTNQHGDIEIDEIRVGTTWADVTPAGVPVELSRFEATVLH
jgi:hypothetical protein